MAGTRKAGSSGSRTVIDSSGLFSKGLNTELHDIEDAAMYSSEECNCVIRPNGSRSRRLGIDYEEGYKFLPETSIDPNGDFAYTAFEWTDIRGTSSKQYIVVQAGAKLFFYENVGAPFSQAPDPFALDLLSEDIRIEGKTAEDVAKEPCRFTQAYGGLFVCSKALKPFFIESLEDPETGSTQFYNNTFASINMKPLVWDNNRSYDPCRTFYFGGEKVLTSHFVGSHLGNGGLGKRYVVVDGSNNKVGRIPMEKVVESVNRLPSQSEATNAGITGAAAGAIIGSIFPVVGSWIGSWVGGLIGSIIGNEKKVHFYTTEIFAMDSNDVIGVATFTGADSTGIAVDSQGNSLGTTKLCNDFYELPNEDTSHGNWPFGSDNEVWHTPTANYYAALWNDCIPAGETSTAKEKTGLTAYAVTPYTFWYPGQPINSMFNGDVEIPEVPVTFPVKADANVSALQQSEYLVFTTTNNRPPRASTIKIEFRDWIDKISHRDAYDFTRESSFSQLYRLSSWHGLTLRIRDLKGYPDKLNGIDMRQGQNISYCPPSLSRVHKYNLYNQGWDTRVRVPVSSNSTETTVKHAINAFYDVSSDFASGISSQVYPANSLQWFVAKDTETQKYASGEVWEGNRLTTFKPENLLQYAFGDTPAPRGHFVLDYFKQDRDFFVDDEESEVEVTEGLNDPIPVEYPRCPYVADIATYAGRVFYLTGDTVLYSQVILEDLSKAGNCYQEADPTSEVISDIVDTDGGMIQIPEIGEGIKLVHIGGTLAVVGTRSTYLISGGSENNFTATAYVGGALQTYSSESPFSFIEAEGSVFYWSTVGVVQLAAGQGGVISSIISENTIQNFYDNIPDAAKRYCRGFFDNATKELWWLYPGDEDKTRVLNKALVLSLKTGAWSPMEFATNEKDPSQSPFVSGGFSLAEAFKVDYRKPLYAEAQGDSVIGSSTWVFPENGGYWEVKLEEDVIGYIYNTQKGYNELVSEPSPAGQLTGYIQFGTDLLLGDKLVGYFGEYNEETQTKPIYDYINVPITLSIGKETIDPVIIHDVYSAPTSPATEPGTVIMSYDSKTEVWTNLRNPVEGYDFKYTSRDLATDEFPYDGTLEYTEATPDSEWRIYKGALMYRISEGYNWTRTGTVQERQKDIVRNLLAEEPIDVDTKGYKSSLFICVDATQSNATFGVLNNLNYKDWATGDWTGSGYDYDSYLVSHPITLDMPYYNKTIPYLLATFRRTEKGFDVKGQPIYPSACQGAILWDWNVNGDSGKWDAQQELYRYDKETLLDSKYITSKTRVYGSGRAFQVKLSAVDNKAFDVENVGFQMYVDGRI